jgi:hypothetical protein
MIAAELCARVRDTQQLSMHVCGCEVYMDELLDLGPVAAGSGVAADFKFKRFSTATLKRVPVRGADEVRAAAVRQRRACQSDSAREGVCKYFKYARLCF